MAQTVVTRTRNTSAQNTFQFGISDRFFLLIDQVFSSKTPWRRGWDSNPRKVALHTLSKRADSAALAPLLVVLLHDIGG